MTIYIIRRLIYSILLIFLSVSMVFFIVNSMPGSPFDRMRNELAQRRSSTAQAIPESHWQRLDSLLGLDRPISERYLTWMESMMSGDMGYSWRSTNGLKVADIIISRLPYTLLLLVASIILSLLVATAIGVYSAIHPYTNTDHILTSLSFFGMSMPTFWIGSLLISIFSIGLGILPFGDVVSSNMLERGDIIQLFERLLTLGAAHPEMAGYEFRVFLDGLWHLILPTFALSLFSIARWSRFIRSSFLEVLHLDYVVAARAKGVPEKLVLSRHVLRNCLIPFITVLALDIPMLFTGSFLTEVVFSWPGIGRLYMDSLRYSDWPVLLGLLVIFSYLIVFLNFFADLLHAAVDPRIKRSMLNQE